MSVKAIAWVLEQQELKGSQKLVMIALADRCNESGMCWPSVERIARAASLSKRSAQRVLGDLEKDGWITRELRAHHQTSRYWVHFDRGANLSPLKTEGCHLVQSGVTNEVVRGDIALSPKPSRTVREPSVPPYSPPTCDDLFEQFWQIYPRGIGKAAARKSWHRAVQAGHDPGDIMDGAVRYQRQRKDEDPKFTAHPSTWLNQERWLDRPEPPPGPGKSQKQRNIEFFLSNLDDPDDHENSNALEGAGRPLRQLPDARRERG
jgi:hypothetical protein